MTTCGEVMTTLRWGTPADRPASGRRCGFVDFRGPCRTGCWRRDAHEPLDSFLRRAAPFHRRCRRPSRRLHRGREHGTIPAGEDRLLDDDRDPSKSDFQRRWFVTTQPCHLTSGDLRHVTAVCSVLRRKSWSTRSSAVAGSAYPSRRLDALCDRRYSRIAASGFSAFAVIGLALASR